MRKARIKRKVRFCLILKWIGTAVIVLLLTLILFLGIIRAITWFANHIRTENGIDEGVYVTLGGQDQYLLIRGENINNPVIIWLHGGPSSPDSFVNYTFEKYLIDEYTIINWDQRGCGRTYFQNIEKDPGNETASFEQAQSDLNELVNYACDRFHTEKVIIIGHSYGTMLGSQYALAHPDKTAAYIGVGQIVTMESDIYSYEDALKIAKENGDDTSAMEMAYQTFAENNTLINMINLRSQVSKYHVAEKEANTIWLGIASPYMGIDDLRWFLKQAGDFQDYIQLNQHLFDYIMTADVRDYGLEYQIPVGFISGSDDWTTPVKFSEDYCDAISAPDKQFHCIDGCGHSPQYDAPEEFCNILKNMLDTYLE